MHKLLWCSDIHLDHLLDTNHIPGRGTEKRYSQGKVKSFCDKILAKNPDSVLITGDISLAPVIEIHLGWLEENLPNLPIRFVLGNHDYYHGSIREVRSRVQKYDGTTDSRLIWLNTQGVVPLTKNTALVGHDGWYDGGYGNWHASRLVMTEYHITDDFRLKHPQVIFERMQELAQECADHIDKHVQAAAKTHKNVLFATHVPAFRNNSRAPDKRMSDPQWLPNMSSKKAGNALLRAADEFPDVQFTCLSGHTHTGWEEQYLPNLREITGNAAYGSPGVSIRVLEVE